MNSDPQYQRMSHGVVRVSRDALASHMTCPLCNKLFRDATTIIECLHTFCWKCIHKKLSDDKMNSCPVCNIDLGCTPLEKLRSDHALENIRVQIFPSKSIKVKSVEMVTHVTLPTKRKKRTISSLVIGTPRATKRNVRERRSKRLARKTSRGSRINLTKRLKKNDDDTESSSSMEVLNKYTRTAKKNSFVTGPSDDHNLDDGKEKTNHTLKRKADLRTPLNYLEAAANKSKPPKFRTQIFVAKSETMYSYDNEEVANKEKSTEKRHNSIVCNEMSSMEDICSELETLKNPKRSRNKVRNSGESTITPPVVLNASNAKIGPTNRPIWFSLVASDINEENNPPLPQISGNYIRIKDGSMQVSFIQKYLKKKLDLTSEDEVELKCMGQRVCPTSTLNNLMEMWIRTFSTEIVSVTIGSSAENFVMVLNYARGFPDLNKTPTIYLSE